MKVVEKVEDKFGLDRIVFFSDAVIAIAITLLVIEIKAPVIEAHLVSKELLPHLLEMWPEFLGYAVSFMVISMYWIAHHRIFRNIKDYNRQLVNMNILFLMFIAFMPFVTSLLFKYPAQMISVVFYAGLVTLIGVSSLFIWLYAVKNNLTYNTLDHKIITKSLLASPIIFLASIIIAFFNPLVAMLSWIILLPLFIVSRSRGTIG